MSNRHGTRKEIKRQKRGEAIIRQKANIKRGYYVQWNRNGIAIGTGIPAPIEEF